MGDGTGENKQAKKIIDAPVVSKELLEAKRAKLVETHAILLQRGQSIQQANAQNQAQLLRVEGAVASLDEILGTEKPEVPAEKPEEPKTEKPEAEKK